MPLPPSLSLTPCHPSNLSLSPVHAPVPVPVHTPSPRQRIRPCYRDGHNPLQNMGLTYLLQLVAYWEDGLAALATLPPACPPISAPILAPALTVLPSYSNPASQKSFVAISSPTLHTPESRGYFSSPDPLPFPLSLSLPWGHPSEAPLPPIVDSRLGTISPISSHRGWGSRGAHCNLVNDL